jgi:hypothetical protein
MGESRGCLRGEKCPRHSISPMSRQDAYPNDDTLASQNQTPRTTARVVGMCAADAPASWQVSVSSTTLPPPMISVVRPSPTFPPHPPSPAFSPHPLREASLDSVSGGLKGRAQERHTFCPTLINTYHVECSNSGSCDDILALRDRHMFMEQKGVKGLCPPIHRCIYAWRPLASP